MATIRKRGHKYQAIIRRQGYAPTSKTFHKRSDAQEWTRFIEAKMDRGDLPTKAEELHRHRLKDILIKYKDEISIKKLSYNSEVHIINALIRKPFASLSLKQLNASHFSAYRDQRLKTVKPGTVNRELTIVQHALDTAALEWDIPLKENPLAKLKKLKVNNARNRRLKDGEEEVLLSLAQQCNNPHIKPIIEFALETAMRRGEILNVRHSDIDRNKRTLLIPIAKNGHAREIPLTPKALYLLINAAKQSERCFPITANAFRLSWQRLLKKTNIEDLRFHDLRHEAISRFFERGLSVPEVALISGHRDFRMLARYTHMKAEVVAKKLSTNKL